VRNHTAHPRAYPINTATHGPAVPPTTGQQKSNGQPPGSSDCEALSEHLRKENESALAEQRQKLARDRKKTIEDLKGKLKEPGEGIVFRS